MGKKQKKLAPDKGFGLRLRELRQKRGFSQESLAQKIGYKTSVSVSNIESGRTPPDVWVLAKIASVLNADLHWLVTGDTSSYVSNIVNRLRPYAIAHLSDVTIQLQKLQRERQDLYTRNAQGESLQGAIQDVESLIEQQHRYYEKAFRELDEILNIATHASPEDPRGENLKECVHKG